ncbi:hypothetical protein [Alteriqipengyuania lutimaris]|nr:hypothetical protein [Alteriqipengyuania lutimaris]MBB3034076.1 hypothetical protein [Alteriqipengyuania lutimaris]
MKTADERAASIRRRATRCDDPRQSMMLHRLADEAQSIQLLPPH